MAMKTTSRRKRDVVQVKNPRSGRYVKIDRGAGVIVSHKKSPGPYKGVPVARKRRVPSDFVRTEYVAFDDEFETAFVQYLDSLQRQADHYEEVASLLEKNPVLALDYLKRAFLISGDERLRTAAQALIGSEGLDARAKNSVERLAASF